MLKSKIKESESTLQVKVNGDVAEMLSTLETYNFIKIEKSETSNRKKLEAAIWKVYCCMKKSVLQQYLIEIPLFKEYLLQ